MRRKVKPSQQRRKRSIEPGPSAKLKVRTEPAEVAGPSEEHTTETEIPLDAEELVLASLEAKVRAEETRVDLGSAEPLGNLTISLPPSLITKLQDRAAARNDTPSRLIEEAVVEYLLKERVRRRGG